MKVELSDLISLKLIPNLRLLIVVLQFSVGLIL